MSIDAKKLKKILTRNEILPIEYYRFRGENECCMVKCLLTPISQFLLIYIPSRHRFTLDSSHSSYIYDLDDLEEDKNDDDDYTKTEEDAYKNESLSNEKETKYQLLQKKYKFPITMDGTDEPIARKVKRQLNRIESPLKKTEYNLAIQQDEFLFVSFGESMGYYHIKGYRIPNEFVRSMMYVTTITEIIEKIEAVQREIFQISEKFDPLLDKIIDSNISEISDQIENFSTTFAKIKEKKEDLVKQIKKSNSTYVELKESETQIMKEYREVEADVKSSHEKVKKTEAIQKELDELFSKKNELIRKTILLMYRYHKIVLYLEEISFDNSIMIDRVKKNFILIRNL